MAKTSDKKSDIVPRLIEDPQAIALASEKMVMTEKSLTELQNQFNDELATIIEARRESEAALRAHVMAGGELPAGMPFKLTYVDEKETITYSNTLIAWFEAQIRDAAPELFQLMQMHKHVVVQYDAEAIAELVSVYEETNPSIAKLFNRVKKRTVKAATTVLNWEK